MPAPATEDDRVRRLPYLSPLRSKPAFTALSLVKGSFGAQKLGDVAAFLALANELVVVP